MRFLADDQGAGEGLSQVGGDDGFGRLVGFGDDVERRRLLPHLVGGQRPEARQDLLPGGAGEDRADCSIDRVADQIATWAMPPRTLLASMLRHSTSWPSGSGRLFGIDSHSRNSSRSWPLSASSSNGVRP